jgi:hypothetical protein
LFDHQFRVFYAVDKIVDVRSDDVVNASEEVCHEGDPFWLVEARTYAGKYRHFGLDD